MGKHQRLIEKFKGRPLINIILDGYGLGKQDHTDAIHLATTSFMDLLRSEYVNTKLATHGKHVGLPGKNDIGGSEVGHLTIGAGRIVPQAQTLISNALKDESFFQRPCLQEALKQAKKGALHLLGLLSDGNVHSHISHFIAIIEEAHRQGISKCYVHALLDGRDVGIQTAELYTAELEELFDRINANNSNLDYTFASAGGREVITMDRDKNWSKIELGWRTHFQGNSGHNFNKIQEGITYFRKLNSDLIDQDCPPFNIRNRLGEIPKIQDGDALIHLNFRGDRAIEFSQAVTEEDFHNFDRGKKPDIYFAGMMVYDEDRELPKNRIMRSPVVENPFGKRLNQYGLSQFRLTETQKYAHVTFFFNGGYHQPLIPEKEHYCLIDSDKLDSFAQAPKMKAFEIAQKAKELILSKHYDFGLINIANADMVGHTGDMKAAIQAVEAVDQALRLICESIKEVNGLALITADHGNADEMLITNKRTQVEERSTKHSLNLVPCVLYDPLYQGDYQWKQFHSEQELNLSMIAATNHILLGREIPKDLNPSLFEEN